MMKTLLLVALYGVLVAPSQAATRTVELSVPGMTCAACPVTVRMALSWVDGVRRVEVVFKEREAVVTYDDARTSVRELLQATKEAGYPSSLKRNP